MGKIRVKTLGVDELEKQEKKEAKKRQESKKVAKSSVEEPAKTPEVKAEEVKQPEAEATEKPKKSFKEKKATAAKTTRSKHYVSAKTKIDTGKSYPVTEALALLPEVHLAKFDETVELHINAIEQGISGNLSLPHGTGKKTRVAIADDKLLAAVEKGVIDFDILVATPDMMPKLAKVAKVLGPRGLMPNPKNGTVTANPDEVVKKYEGGQIRFKSEAKAPVIHLTVGKLSFGDKKLSENIKAVFKAIPTSKVKNVILKSTMSPAIKISLAAL